MMDYEFLGAKSSCEKGTFLTHRHHTSEDSAVGSSDNHSRSKQERGLEHDHPTDEEPVKSEKANATLPKSAPRRYQKLGMTPEIQYWFKSPRRYDDAGVEVTVPKTPNNDLFTKSIHNNKVGAQSSTTDQVHIDPKHIQSSMCRGEGKITAKELKLAFANFQGRHFSDGVCKFVVRLFDLDRNGGLDVKEFEQLYSYVKLWVNAFNAYDRQRTGHLTEKEFANALQHMDIHFTPEFISFLVARHDPVVRKISLDQFIVTCVQIQRYTDEFKNRDDTYSGTISLKYEDFLEMILRCL